MKTPTSSSVHRRRCGGASFSPSERQVCTLVGLSLSLRRIHQRMDHTKTKGAYQMREGDDEQVLAMLERLRGQGVCLSTLDRHMRACLCCLESKTRDERRSGRSCACRTGCARGEFELTEVRGMNGAPVCASCKRIHALLRGGHSGERAVGRAMRSVSEVRTSNRHYSRHEHIPMLRNKTSQRRTWTKNGPQGGRQTAQSAQDSGMPRVGGRVR